MSKEVKYKNVEEIYNNGLCCSCGMCIGVCDSKAISYTYDRYGYFKPVIDMGKCILCQKCSAFCPGGHYFAFKNTAVKNPAERYYVGYSMDSETRFNSASGGITTELLIYLLKANIVDSCIVVESVSNVKDVHPIATNDVNIIRHSKASKYCPVPLGEILPLIKKGERYAIVGVPCQIQVLRKIFAKEQERLIFISLFCNHCSSANATEFLLHCMENGKDSCNISYRGNGWPGNISLTYTDGSRSLIPFRSVYLKSFGKYFFNDRCRLCNDPFGEFADISMADAFNCSAVENGPGQTLCFVRNPFLQTVLLDMAKKKTIFLKECSDYESIINSFPAQKNRTENAIRIIKTQQKYFPKKPLPINHEKLLNDLGVGQLPFPKALKYYLKIKLFKYFSCHKFFWTPVFKILQHQKEVIKK